MRTLIPHILDINVVSWVDHHLDSIEKLKLALDKEFEYVDNKLSTVGFRNVVKRWLKTKRTKSKTRFLEERT
jgi:oligoribonuclease NrnB/cAMP/cGMP phosphodiesterase (DHH superfamily)